jgi:hypothetical protein
MATCWWKAKVRIPQYVEVRFWRGSVASMFSDPL